MSWQRCGRVFVAISLCSVPALAAGQVKELPSSTPSALALAEANESAIGLIHSADLVIDISVDRVRGLPARNENEQMKRSWRWSKRDDVERIRYRYDYLRPEDGLPVNIGDMIQDGRTRRTLLNWDPTNPQKIEPLNNGTVKARVEPQTPRLPGFFAHPSVFLGLRMQLNSQDLALTLAELVRASPRAEVRGKVRIHGYDTWRIFVEHPNNSGPKSDGSFYEVFVDPAVNFMVRRVEAHDRATTVDKLKVSPYTYSREIQEFHDCGGGVFVPTRFEDQSLGDGRAAPSMVLHGDVRNLTVNVELPPDALDFAFPKHVLVRFLPPVNGKAKKSLWGDNDTPILEVHKAQDLVEYTRRLSPASRASSVLVFVLANIAIAFAIIAILSYRKVRNAARPST